MKLTRTIGLILCIITMFAGIAFADEDRIHPEVMPDDYEWSMWISPDEPAEHHIERYAEKINEIVPALQVIAHNGVVAPSLEVLHGYAQVIIHGLEGSGGPHGDLIPLQKEIPDLGREMPPTGSPRSTWIEYFGSEEALTEFEDSPSPKAELLAPLSDSLDVVKSANSVFRQVSNLYPSREYIGLITIRGGAIWAMDWMLPQLSIYAQEVFADNPGQQLYIEALGSQVHSLLQRALDSAVACIGETDYDTAAAHMLDVNAYLFTAMGNSLSPGERPVTATGLFFLMNNLLGWTGFGF
jgi:hypothetical protein